MKTIPLLLAAAVAAGTLRAAAAAETAPAPVKSGLNTTLVLISRDYKKPEEVPESFFNPFKIDTATEITLQKKAAASVTNEMITDAVGHRGVSGIIFAPETGLNRVIIGDQVFCVGDELTFPDGDKGGTVPLVANANVILRVVDPKNLVFDFGAEGETPRRASYPLRSFWRQ